MEKHVKVSVIIPTYNRANLVEKAIKSVLNQTYQDFEIIVVDDASTDNTEEVIKNFSNKRIKYIKCKKNKGDSFARNTGIKIAKGEYIAFLDSDDEWLREKLEKQIKVLDNKPPEVGAVYSDVLYIDKNGKNLNRKLSNPGKEGYIYEELFGGNCVGTPSTLLIRKECFNRVGLFDVLIGTFSDWDMWIRIAKYYRFTFIKVPLVKYRIHFNRMSENLELKIISAERILSKYTEELGKQRDAHSKLYFNIGRMFCFIGKYSYRI